jgi:3-oxoacyl-[acyl-carrier protein] reductase
MELEGKVAIVTGAARGIGRGIALDLGRAGARVVINYRNSAEEAEALAQEIPDARVVQADVSQTADCERLVAAALDWGSLDILVNNAGIKADGLALTMTDEAFDSVMAVNAGGCFRMCRAAIQTMVRERSGSIVNLTSISGIRGNPGQMNYSASKAAIVGMTRTLAREIAKRKVRVNAVAPGFVETDMIRALPEQVLQEVQRRIPMRRYGTVEDISHMVRFLVGPHSHYITGQVFVVDGGLSC